MVALDIEAKLRHLCLESPVPMEGGGKPPFHFSKGAFQ